MSRYHLVKFSPKRTFGVELEFNRETNREFLKKVVVETGETAKLVDWGHHSNNTDWLCKTDSSCGYEIASRVLGSNRSVRRTLDDLVVLDRVVTQLRERGAAVDGNCGTHVHIWIGDFDDQEYTNLLYYWAKFEKTLVDMMPERRKKNRYCPCPSAQLSPNQKLSADQLLSQGYRDRGSMNVGWYKSRQTVEFRLAEGSVDPFMIRNWVRFLLHFVELVPTFPRPENVNWLTFTESLSLLKMYNPPGAETFHILSPALAETRSWILQRTNEYANFRDCEKIKNLTRDLLAQVG